MNELALFAGAGGGILGGILCGFRTICAVEIEPFCREILLRRQRDGLLPMFPIWDDIKTFDGKPWRGLVDVISAGFPCQPFSVAGKSLGVADERNLWPDTIRVLREVGPRFALLENVPGLLAHDYFGQILGDLAEAGFDAEWDVVSAEEAGAPHKRERLWIVCTDAKRGGVQDDGSGEITGAKSSLQGDGEERERFRPDSGELRHVVAHAEGNGWEQGRAESTRQQGGPDAAICGEQVANPLRPGLEERHPPARNLQPRSGPCGWWSAEPALGRVADGVAHRVGQLTALGNGQVPRVVKEAWRRLKP